MFESVWIFVCKMKVEVYRDGSKFIISSFVILFFYYLCRFLVLFYVLFVFYEIIYLFYCRSLLLVLDICIMNKKKRLYCLSFYNCDSWDYLIFFFIVLNYFGYMFFVNWLNNVLIFLYVKVFWLVNRCCCYNRKKKKI